MVPHYTNYPQGIIIAGGKENRQIVFSAVTGRPMSETEPGYPPSGFPFGWQAHQLGKQIHRGDYFGLTGRFLDLLAGLALLYLCVNGIALYYELWTERRREGHKTLFWVDHEENQHQETEV
jgi:uncharacterized iron-regulated membrane protein